MARRRIAPKSRIKKNRDRFAGGAMIMILSVSIAVGISLDSMGGESDPEYPNLVIFSLDTVRADHLGAYGAARMQTPFIDRLAMSGLQVRRIISGSPATLISHATIFTSLYPETHQAAAGTRTVLAPRFVTLAERLKSAGYVTAAFTAGGQLNHLAGLDQGFDTYADDYIPGDQVYRRAEEWLRRLDSGRPFFLFLHHYDNHMPYHLGDMMRRYYAPGVNPAKKGAPYASGDGSWRSRSELSGEQMHRLYRAAVASSDRLLAKMYKCLVDVGRAKNTVIVVLADHGEEFGEHGWWALHGHSLYTELLDVPLIFYATPLEGREHLLDTPVHGVDILPTTLGLLGFDHPGFSCQGIDILRHPPPCDRILYSKCVLDGRKIPLIGAQIGEQKWIRLLDGRIIRFDEGIDPGENSGLSFGNADEPLTRIWQMHIKECERLRSRFPDRFPVTIHVPLLDRTITTFEKCVRLTPANPLHGWVDLPRGDYIFSLEVDPDHPGAVGDSIAISLEGSPEVRISLPARKPWVDFEISAVQAMNHDFLIRYRGTGDVCVGDLRITPRKSFRTEGKLEEELKSLGYIR